MEAEFLATFNTASKATDAAALTFKLGGDPDEGRCLDALRGLKTFPVGKSPRCLTKHPKIQAFASDLLQEWSQMVMEEANGCKKVANGKNGDGMKVTVKSETPTESTVLKSFSLRVQVARSDSFKVRKMVPNGRPGSAKFADFDVPVTDAAAYGGEEEKWFLK